MRLLGALLLVLAIPRPVFAAPLEGGAAAGSLGLPRLLPLLQVTSPKCSISTSSEHIYFNYRSVAIRPSSYPALDDWVARLKKNPGLTRLLIAGHTDSWEPDAVELSWQRVAAVMEYLLERGIEPHRLKLGAYGFQFPLQPNDSPDHRADNRRVDLVIFEQVGKVDPLPPVGRCPIKIYIPPAPTR